MNIRNYRFLFIINVNYKLFTNILSKFKLRDPSAYARNIGRTFLRSTLKIIQLNVLHHIFINYKPEFI